MMTTDTILPPQAIDLEEAVLGAVLIDHSALVNLSNIIYPEAFYKSENAIIYSCISEMIKSGRPVDILTVSQELRNKGKIDEVGGEYYIAKLSQKVASSAHVEHHARIVIQKHIHRELIKATALLRLELANEDIDVFDTLEQIPQRFSDAAKHVTGGMEIHITEALKDALRVMDVQASGTLVGVSSSIQTVNRVLGCYNDGDLIILGARPGMGKTAKMLNEVVAACRQEKRVRVCSVEMTSAQLTLRLMSIVSGVDSFRLRNGNLSGEDSQRVNKAVAEIEKWNLIIDEEIGLSKIILGARSAHMKEPFDIMFVDYLQRIKHQIKGRQRHEEVAEIAKEMKTLAKQLRIPVYVLAQIGRENESVTKIQRPKMSDLRESGDIEQEADVVMMLYRPEYYGIEEWDNGDGSCIGEADLMVVKNRHGETKNLRLTWNGATQTFEAKRREFNVEPTPY